MDAPSRRVPGPFFYLREDERVLLRLKPGPAYAFTLFLRSSLLPTLLLAISLAALRLVPAARGVAPAWAPWSVWGLLLVVVALVAWRRAATSEYALTDERIYARAGRMVTRVHFTTHDKVTDIHYHQGPLGRLFGLADLTFSTAGGDVHVAGIREALRLKGAAESARDSFVRALLRELPAGAATETPDLAAPAPAPRAARIVAAPLAEWTGPRPPYLQAGDTPVWYAKPRPIVAVAALRGLIGLVPLFFFLPRIPETYRPLVALAALALIVGSVASRFLQVQRMEYVATDRRVYARMGVVGTSVSQLTYDKITDIAYHQDLLGRLLGYGSVTLQTAGGQQAPITMIGLADPLAAKETIEGWRDASVQGAS